MWALSITSPNAPRRFQIFLSSEVRVGALDSANDVILPGADDRHARFVVKSAKYIIVDLKSRDGTHVNGRRITSPLVVRGVDEIVIADHKLSILDVAAKRSELRATRFDPDEEVLLDYINAGDEHSREVYADLLESRGDLVRAELVRIIDQGNRSLRVLELMTSTTVWWRMRIARSPIEACTELGCPRTWNALRNQRDEVRRCATCNRDVHYCVDVEEATTRMPAGRVAFDPLSLRWDGDLNELVRYRR